MIWILHFMRFMNVMVDYNNPADVDFLRIHQVSMFK